MSVVSNFCPHLSRPTNEGGKFVENLSVKTSVSFACATFLSFLFRCSHRLFCFLSFMVGASACLPPPPEDGKCRLFGPFFLCVFSSFRRL